MNAFIFVENGHFDVFLAISEKIFRSLGMNILYIQKNSHESLSMSRNSGEIIQSDCSFDICVDMCFNHSVFFSDCCQDFACVIGILAISIRHVGVILNGKPRKLNSVAKSSYYLQCILLPVAIIVHSRFARNFLLRVEPLLSEFTSCHLFEILRPVDVIVRSRLISIYFLFVVVILHN